MSRPSGFTGKALRRRITGLAVCFIIPCQAVKSLQNRFSKHHQIRFPPAHFQGLQDKRQVSVYLFVNYWRRCQCNFHRGSLPFLVSGYGIWTCVLDESHIIPWKAKRPSPHGHISGTCPQPWPPKVGTPAPSAVPRPGPMWRGRRRCRQFCGGTFGPGPGLRRG